MYSVNFPSEGKSEVFGLDVSKIGSGATGTIYAFEAFGNKYAAKIIKNISEENRDRIQSMISMSSALREKNKTLFDRLAWPIGEVYKEGKIVGFAMRVLPESEFIPFESFFDYNLRDRLPSSDFTSISLLAELVTKLAELLSFLHTEGIYVVDLKPQNIRVAKKDLSVFVLDCDSFSFKSQVGRSFPAGFVSADYICPETMRKKLSPSDLGEGQDRYAFAVLVFQMFNRGIHPFQGVVSDTTVDAPTNDQKAELGLYAYGLVPHSQIAAHPRSAHESWPPSLRLLFDRAFTQEDMARPSLANWSEYFVALAVEKKFRRCRKFPADPKHIHFSEGECVECYLKELQTGSEWKAAADAPQKQTPTAPITPSPKAQSSALSKNDNLIWYVIALIAVLIVFGGIANNTPSNSSAQRLPVGAPNTTSNVTGSATGSPTTGSVAINGNRGAIQPRVVVPQVNVPLVSSEVRLSRLEMQRLRLALYRQLQIEAMPRNIPQITERLGSLPEVELEYIRTFASRSNIRLTSGLPNREVANRLLALPNEPRRLVATAARGERRVFSQWSSFQRAHDNFCVVSTTAIGLSSNSVTFLPELRGHASPRESGSVMSWRMTYPLMFDERRPVYGYVDGVRFSLEIVDGVLRPARNVDRRTLDASVIRAMRAGNSLVISGVNRLTGEGLFIEFSLIGFTRAFNDMMARCNRNDLRVWIYNN